MTTAHHQWDESWLQRALNLAVLGQHSTSPNPMVGAVVLDRNGLLVGEGFHRAAGEPHAEVLALAQAGDRARGGTLYVTLEPCCHQGRTPPCTAAVIAAGVHRVVVAMADPDPRVAGKGLRALRSAGITVVCGVAEMQARLLNKGFLHRISHGRPWGILKWAASVDGRIATGTGDSQWISGPRARRYVHELRACCDAVITGGGTVRRDNPLLTSRGRRQPEPLRVVLTRQLQLPDNARLWDQSQAATLVAHPQGANPAGLELFGRRRIEHVPLHPCHPKALLELLAKRGCNRVLWECGPELATAAVQQGCVQEIVAVQAPKLIGGQGVQTPLGDLGITLLPNALPLRNHRMEWAGEDLVWRLLLPTETR